MKPFNLLVAVSGVVCLTASSGCGRREAIEPRVAAARATDVHRCSPKRPLGDGSAAAGIVGRDIIAFDKWNGAFWVFSPKNNQGTGTVRRFFNQSGGTKALSFPAELSFTAETEVRGVSTAGHDVVSSVELVGQIPSNARIGTGVVTERYSSPLLADRAEAKIPVLLVVDHEAEFFARLEDMNSCAHEALGERR